MKLTQYQKNRNVNFNKLIKRIEKDFNSDNNYILNTILIADFLYKDLRQKRKLKIKKTK